MLRAPRRAAVVGTESTPTLPRQLLDGKRLHLRSLATCQVASASRCRCAPPRAATGNRCARGAPGGSPRRAGAGRRSTCSRPATGIGPGMRHGSAAARWRPERAASTARERLQCRTRARTDPRCSTSHRRTSPGDSACARPSRSSPSTWPRWTRRQQCAIRCPPERLPRPTASAWSPPASAGHTESPEESPSAGGCRAGGRHSASGRWPRPPGPPSCSPSAPQAAPARAGASRSCSKSQNQ